MVYDDAFTISCGHGIIFALGLITHAAADKAHDDIVCIDRYVVIFNADAVAGGCLSGYGYIS